MLLPDLEEQVSLDGLGQPSDFISVLLIDPDMTPVDARVRILQLLDITGVLELLPDVLALPSFPESVPVDKQKYKKTFFFFF